MLKKSIFLFITLLLSFHLKAQVSKTDSIASVLKKYSSKTKSSVFFIHFDKNIYTNNERVWFTGYLLKSVADINQYNTLYLSVINNADSSVVLKQKFLINNGFAFGSLTLPDSVQSGAYRFVANANIRVNGIPDVEFVQPITIKSTTENPLVTSLTVFKANDEKTGKGTLLLKALTGSNRFIQDAEVNYTIGRKGNFIQAGKAKTSIIGELMIDYPANKINGANNLITVTVKKDSHIRYEELEIPYPKVKEYKVNFFPEGGYLVCGIQNKVGWEVKDNNGILVSAKGILYENERVVDTIGTGSSGLGSFTFLPKIKHKYYVKLLTENNLIGSFELPGTLNEGTNMRLNSAIGTQALKLVIESSFGNKVHLIVHNYDEIFLATELKLKTKKPLNVLLKLDSVPKGLNTITLLDSLYRPVAERVFIAHYDETDKIEINSDKEEYLTRDSIKLKLKISDQNGIGLRGLVSIAAVQANRMSASNNMNIVDYGYLEHQLGNLPPNPTGSKYDDLGYLEDILLVKGWRKYKWPEQKEVNGSSQIEISQYEYQGSITKNKKQLKVPILINTIAAKNVNTFSTDSSGRFILLPDYLIADERTKVWLNLNDKNFFAYDFNLVDPFDEIGSLIKKRPYTNHINSVAYLATGNENITSPAGIKLNEVTIKKTKDNSIDFQPSLGRNKCGDYVCQYGILNCENHSTGTMPVKGKAYRSNNLTVIYQGCLENEIKPNFLVLNGISLPKEFYSSDIKNLNEPITFATVYWNYQTLLDGKTETPLAFTSGDLTGEFKIIIQGVTERGVVYGEKSIRIKRK